MRNTLQTLTKPWETECGILILDLIEGKGTRWICWIVKNDECFHFDSYGFVSPIEFDNYIKMPIWYSQL